MLLTEDQLLSLILHNFTLVYFLVGLQLTKENSQFKSQWKPQAGILPDEKDEMRDFQLSMIGASQSRPSAREKDSSHLQAHSFVAVVNHDF